MTDPKKPRTPRELPVSEAIDRIVTLGQKDAFVERYVAHALVKAEGKARRDAPAAFDAALADVLRRVDPDVQGIVSHKAAQRLTLYTPGPVAKAEEPTADAPIIPEGGVTVPAAELRGTAEYIPGPAARAARGAR